MHRSLALLLLCLISACNETATTAADPNNNTNQNPPEGLYARWDFVGGNLWGPGNTRKSTSTVNGELYLNRDRTWSQYRVIGTIIAGGEGTFTVRGDTLTLKHNDASGDLVYTYALGTEPHPSGGTRGTMVISSLKAPGEDWFDFGLREFKQ